MRLRRGWERGCESATGKEEKNIVAVCRRREWNGASTVGSKSREDRRTVREKSVGEGGTGAKGQKEGERRCSRRNDNEMG